MADPSARHAAALEALDRLIAAERERLAHGRSVVRNLPNGRSVLAWVSDETSPQLDGLAGRRRILQRHAPEFCHVTEHWVCASCNHVEYPCDDYRDAAAGLEGTDGPT